MVESLAHWWTFMPQKLSHIQPINCILGWQLKWSAQKIPLALHMPTDLTSKSRNHRQPEAFPHIPASWLLLCAEYKLLIFSCRFFAFYSSTSLLMLSLYPLFFFLKPRLEIDTLGHLAFFFCCIYLLFYLIDKPMFDILFKKISDFENILEMNLVLM